MNNNERAKVMTVTVGATVVSRPYSSDDPIWKLEVEKRERRLMADAQRDIAREADRRAQEMVTVRG